MGLPTEHDDVRDLLEAVRALEFVAYAAMNRGHFRQDFQLREAASKGLALAHKALGMTHARDELRCKFDAPRTSASQ